MSVKVLAIFLICLVFALSILDAPEYIRCIHVDLCEFLEIHANLADILKSDIMNHNSCAARDNFFSMLEGLIDTKELIQSLFILYIPVILKSQKNLCLCLIRKTIDLANLEHTSHLVENSFPVKILKLAEISIIRS